MCGYFGNLHECPAVISLLNQLGLALPYPQGQYYQRRGVAGLLTAEGGGYVISDALWWYALKRDGRQWSVNDSVTSFNARELQRPLWRNALRYRRGLVFATEIGEAQGRDRYLMRAPTGLALGALYKDWRTPNGDTQRSMAIITRPPHARFSRFHDRAIPCFLPLELEIIRAWLGGDESPGASDGTQHSLPPAVEALLARPRIYSPMIVTAVKSYKGAEALSEPWDLPADDRSE